MGKGREATTGHNSWVGSWTRGEGGKGEGELGCRGKGGVPRQRRISRERAWGAATHTHRPGLAAPLTSLPLPQFLFIARALLRLTIVCPAPSLSPLSFLPLLNTTHDNKSPWRPIPALGDNNLIRYCSSIKRCAVPYMYVCIGCIICLWLALLVPYRGPTQSPAFQQVSHAIADAIQKARQAQQQRQQQQGR